MVVPEEEKRKTSKNIANIFMDSLIRVLLETLLLLLLF